MRPILRSTAILSSSSVVAIGAGLITAKVLAVLIGPAGLGDLALLQSLIGLTVLIASLGLGTGLIRDGANALANEDARRLAALRRAAWLLTIVLAGLALIALVVFRSTISQWALGSAHQEQRVVLIGIATVIALVSGLMVSTLNAYHRVGALAKYGMLNGVLGAVATIVIIWIWRGEGIIISVIAGSVIGLALALFFLRRSVPTIHIKPSRADTFAAMSSLLRFGAPYTASQLVGTGVQLAIPILVLHELGSESVGLYRAAISISVGYLGFLLTAMSQDYYPRVSAASDHPTLLVTLVNQQQRLVLLLAVPLIFGTLALAPYLVPLIYSGQFSPTVEILEWQLIGDLFKMSSWTMAFAILARCGGITYFFTESIAGATILASNWLAMRWFGLSGLGIAFLFSYIVYFIVVWAVIRREISFDWDVRNVTMLAAAALAAGVIRILPSIGLREYRTVTGLVLMAFFGVFSLRALWNEMGGIERLRIARTV